MGGTFLIPDVGLILLPEIPNGGQDRVGGGLAQAAQRTILDADAQLFQQLDVPLLSFPFADSVEDLHHAGGANPAGDALAAGFPGGKVQEETGDVHHTGAVIHHHHAAGAHDRAGGRQCLIVNGGIHQGRGDTAAGGTAHLHRFVGPAVLNAAGNVKNNILERVPHGNLHQAAPLDFAGESKDLGAFGILRAHGRKGRPAMLNDPGNVGKGLHVVDIRGLVQIAALGREGRLQPGHASLALHGFNQGGLLTAHESAGANFDVQVTGKVRAQDILPQQSAAAGLFNGLTQPLHRQRVLRPDIYNAVGRANGIAADEHSLNDTVGVSLKDRAVHKRAGVPFVSVTNDVLFFPRLMVSSFPFDTSGESCAATAPEARFF